MIRFYLILVFFLISLLSFCKAPEYHLWLLAIGVTEFPLIFFGITLVLSLTGFWISKYQLAGTILGVVTMIIFLSPIFRAYWVAKDIRQDMTKAFTGLPDSNSKLIFPADRSPFSFFSLFKSTKGVAYKTITYVRYKDTSVNMDFY